MLEKVVSGLMALGLLGGCATFPRGEESKCWEQTYGQRATGGFHSLVKADLGYILAGYTVLSEVGERKVWLLAIDKRGSPLWEKVYGVGKNNFVYDLKPTVDGGYILAGSAQEEEVDFLALKLDSFGNLSWSKSFGSKGRDRVYAVEQTLDNGYLVLGQSDFVPQEAWLVKLYPHGEVSWTKSLGESRSFYALTKAKGSGYIAAGKISKGEKEEALVIKLSDSGIVEWAKTFSDEEDIEARSILRTEKGYLVALDSKEGKRDFSLVEIDEEGKELWSRKYPPSFVQALARAKDGGYVLAGKRNVNRNKTEGSDGLVMKVSSNGDLVWEATPGRHLAFDELMDVEAVDDGYLAVGKLRLRGGRTYKGWALKIGEKGEICKD